MTPGRRLQLTPRLSVYWDGADIWVGAYVAPTTIYVCPIPCLVFRWRRRGR